MKKDRAIQFYPNPFDSYTNININDASLLNDTELRIYNVLGEILIYKHIIKQITTIETSNLPSGVYFYNLNVNNKTIQSGKLISRK
ncbi:MAG: T9SS type A sorting domain-containing protein [Bacteroidales bacterium]